MGIKRCIYVGLSFGIMGNSLCQEPSLIETFPGMTNFVGIAIAFYIGIGFVYHDHLDAGDLMTVSVLPRRSLESLLLRSSSP